MDAAKDMAFRLILATGEDLERAWGYWFNYAGTHTGGVGTFDRTCASVLELWSTIALKHHPKLDEIQSGKKVGAEELVRAKVLDGMKIIDLGCGLYPLYARITRALGADTYTVDVISAEDFEYYPSGGFSEKERELERKKHLQLDLTKPDAPQSIIKFAGKDFDLVGSVLVMPVPPSPYREPSDEQIYRIAKGLLKPDGILYDDGRVRRASELA